MLMSEKSLKIFKNRRISKVVEERKSGSEAEISCQNFMKIKRFSENLYIF
jgi:hypothetical protein